MNFDLGNTTVVEKLTNTKEVSKELKQEAIKYIETLQTLERMVERHSNKRRNYKRELRIY